MSAPDHPFQAEVARIVLTAAGHGFALAGGHALIAHGIVSRCTSDIDCFTDEDGGVQAAAALVEVALTAAGLTVENVAEESDLGEVFYGFDRDMVEFEVRRGEQSVRLQLVRFDRCRHPVLLDVGPVLHLDDVIGTKVSALATRGQPRDFVDVAAAMDRYSREQLLDLGLRSDPALTDEEFRDAMRRLDRLDTSVFALYGLSPAQVSDVRARFADWPR